MYVQIETTPLAGAAEAVTHRLRDHVVPLLQGRPGFRGYCAFVTESGDALHAIGLFDDHDSAAAARERVRQWAEAGLRDLLPGATAHAGGEAVFHEVEAPREQGRDRHRALFAVVRTYHGLPGQTETMHSLVSARTLPAIEGAAGFRGFYAFRDEGDPDRAISVTLFDGREEAMRTHAAVMEIMRERLGDMAYDTPTVAMGETVALATA